jgi:glycerol-3-phosphate dehydrogenase
MVCEGLYIIDIFEEYIKTKQMNLPLIETLIGIINGNKDTRKEFEKFIKNI